MEAITAAISTTPTATLTRLTQPQNTTVASPEGVDIGIGDPNAQPSIATVIIIDEGGTRTELTTKGSGFMTLTSDLAISTTVKTTILKSLTTTTSSTSTIPAITSSSVPTTEPILIPGLHPESYSNTVKYAVTGSMVGLLFVVSIVLGLYIYLRRRRQQLKRRDEPEIDVADATAPVSKGFLARWKRARKKKKITRPLKLQSLPDRTIAILNGQGIEDGVTHAGKAPKSKSGGRRRLDGNSEYEIDDRKSPLHMIKSHSSNRPSPASPAPTYQTHAVPTEDAKVAAPLDEQQNTNELTRAYPSTVFTRPVSMGNYEQSYQENVHPALRPELRRNRSSLPIILDTSMFSELTPIAPLQLAHIRQDMAFTDAQNRASTSLQEITQPEKTESSYESEGYDGLEIGYAEVDLNGSRRRLSFSYDSKPNSPRTHTLGQYRKPSGPTAAMPLTAGGTGPSSPTALEMGISRTMSQPTDSTSNAGTQQNIANWIQSTPSENFYSYGIPQPPTIPREQSEMNLTAIGAHTDLCPDDSISVVEGWPDASARGPKQKRG